MPFLDVYIAPLESAGFSWDPTSDRYNICNPMTRSARSRIWTPTW